VCARIVKGHPAFRRIRLISFRDFLSGPTSPSSVDRTRRRWKRHVALSVSLPRSPRSSEPRYGPCCETLHTFTPPARRESTNMHAALVLRLHLGWMDDRECLDSSAPRIVPAEARYNVLRRCPQPAIGPLSALLRRCSHSVSSAVFRTTLSAAQAVYRTFRRSGLRRSADRLAASPAPVPKGPSVWGPSACQERFSHCIGTHPTPFMSLESTFLLCSGCSYRLKTPDHRNHGELAPRTLSMSDSRPRTAFFFLGWPAPVPAGGHANKKMMQSASRESSASTSESRRSPLLLRGILRIAPSHFEHLVDERYAHPVLLHE